MQLSAHLFCGMLIIIKNTFEHITIAKWMTYSSQLFCTFLNNFLSQKYFTIEKLENFPDKKLSLPFITPTSRE